MILTAESDHVPDLVGADPDLDVVDHRKNVEDGHRVTLEDEKEADLNLHRSTENNDTSVIEPILTNLDVLVSSILVEEPPMRNSDEFSSVTENSRAASLCTIKSKRNLEALGL
jgi:hypothetical protein